MSLSPSFLHELSAFVSFGSVGWVRVITLWYSKLPSMYARMQVSDKSPLINRAFRAKGAVRGHGQRCVQLSWLLIKVVSGWLETRARST